MRRDFELEGNRIVSCAEGEGSVTIFVNPDPEERKYLITGLGVDEHTLASSLDPDELSRLEFEPDHVALIFKMPKSYSGEDQLQFRVCSTGAFLFKDRLVLVMSEEVPLFEGKQFLKVSSLNSLFLKVINRSAHHFMEHLRVINLLTEELEDRINTSMENTYLINLFTLGKSLVYYLNAINSNAIVIAKLKNNVQKIGLNTEEAEFLDDIMVDNNQCYRQAEIYSNILSNLMDARVSIVNNNLNILMKTLNIIILCIMLPQFVVSAFSMNVAMPMQHHPLAFWFIMGISLLSTLVVVVFWKYKKL
ncbi:MAG TPA: magnesium transporter CorA family protein [Deltaproteobacteria bacterium]|nr:magnesium transporter CorA family protein [Deltaproteobacteria bacterium]HOM27892.1 magnesium transporter CorA family protein [Deltaproteobacteria bacterium]HPP79414.1 magnesium transporter CorA family protein [Deltaproteobacteria bacterium]